MKNQVQLIGNIGTNPEITNFDSATKKVGFTLATNEFFTTKEGKREQRTWWHNLYAWGSTANYIAKMGKKETQVASTDKLVTQKHLSKEGATKAFTAVEVQRAIAL